MEDTGSVLVHPYDDKRIIIGQGTTALELLSKYPDLEIIIVPISGGGLLAGTLSYLKIKIKILKYMEQSLQWPTMHFDH